MRPISGLILLLLIMLNHAVLACDAMVMHLPDHHHSYTSSSHSHEPTTASASHADTTAQDDEHNHLHHAHVSCHIAYYYRFDAAPANTSAIAAITPSFNAISYQPAVPPPNA
ncbi:cobalt transporter [Rheinheimera pleomorphica]|uniref:cobalt transporter n=1 Tax=Rheinheimera pleomorphica TaxID=2703963 RepID=UPI001F513C19|nr:cobalt transporter [Rheinheimera pleomorphica]